MRVSGSTPRTHTAQIKINTSRHREGALWDHLFPFSRLFLDSAFLTARSGQTNIDEQKANTPCCLCTYPLSPKSLD
jgi:hypothetical protein